jgi:hypothetical protein
MPSALKGNNFRSYFGTGVDFERGGNVVKGKGFVML